MRVRLLAPLTLPLPGTLEAAGKTKETAVFDGIMDDYKFLPDVVTVNGQKAYKFAYQVREAGQIIAIYREIFSVNLVVTTPTNSTPQEVSDGH